MGKKKSVVEDFAARYAALQEAAAGVNHAVYVIVVPGLSLDPSGQECFVQPEVGAPNDLASALAKIEAYVASDDAAALGDATRRRDDAQEYAEYAADHWLRRIENARDRQEDLEVLVQARRQKPKPTEQLSLEA